MYTKYKMVWRKAKHAYMAAAGDFWRTTRDDAGVEKIGLGVKARSRTLKWLVLGALVLGSSFTGFMAGGVRAADAGDSQPHQYIAFKNGNAQSIPHATADTVGKSLVLDGKTYIGREVYGSADGKPRYYWVREGYAARILQGQRFNGANTGDRVDTYKKDTLANSEGLLIAFDADNKHMPGKMLNGGELDRVKAVSFGGASSGNWRVKKNWPVIEVNGKWQRNDNQFQALTPDGLTGTYSYNGEVLGASELYVVEGNVGIFVVNGKRYTGNVYGANNEILKTGIGSDNKYYSFWAAEIHDPRQTVGDMTVRDFNEKILAPLAENDYKLHTNDIKEIKVSGNGAGGVLGLTTNGEFNADNTARGGADIPGSVRIANTAGSGTGGQDVGIQFSNDNGSFSVNAGSKVSAVVKAGTANMAEGLVINGERYDFARGSTDDFHLAGGKEVLRTAAGNDPEILGYRVKEDGMLELVVQNGNDESTRKTVVIGNLASKTAVDALESRAVKYDANGDGTVNYGAITVGGEAGPRYDAGKKTGGTRVTNVAYADGTDGSEAVNVDRLNDSIRAAVKEGNDTDQHVKAGEYAVGSLQKTDGTAAQGVSLDLVNNKGEAKGRVLITDMAKASDVGQVGDFHESLKNGNGAHTTVVEAVNRLDDKVGDLKYKRDDGENLAVVKAGDNVTAAIGKLDQAVAKASEAAGKHSTVSAGRGITVDRGTNAAGGDDYHVGVADDFTLGGKAGQGSLAVKGAEGAIQASGTVTAGAFQSGDVLANANGNGLISGLHNIEWHHALLEKAASEGGYKGSSHAATESQLRQAVRGAIQYDRDKDGNIDPTRITLNPGSTPAAIHNLKEGKVEKDSREAVNGGQLWETRKQLEETHAGLAGVTGSISRLGNRVNRVGAGAAALAALHPLDFDPDAKWDFSAGYGNYNGANAMAVGAYYRPNEDLLFSVGTSLGGGENMVNAGISVKLGSGSSHVTTSRTAMAKEIVALREHVEKLTELVNQLAGERNKEQGPSVVFPDVPENRWAYDYVRQLAGNGILEGYGEGRPMTRYEWASLIYRALENGAAVDAGMNRLIQEFRPELALIRVDTGTKDSSGNPVIERLRVNRLVRK